MEEIKHGREYKPGEEGELTDTGERITFPMSEAALSSIEERRRLAAEHEAARAALSSIEERRRLAAEHEAARAAENVSKSDTPGSGAGHSKIPVWGPKPELTFEFLENPDRYASLKTRIDQLRDLYGEEYDIKITVKDVTVNMAGIEMLQGMQF